LLPCWRPLADAVRGGQAGEVGCGAGFGGIGTAETCLSLLPIALCFQVPNDAGMHELTMSERSPVRGDTPKGELATKPRAKTQRPSLYKVLLLNDDYTPMEFVVHVLERFFNKNREDATRIMLHVHHNGVGICGIFTYEVAETKVAQVIEFSRQNQHPLQCTMEKE
jgi:ATP-dependent Clp protease adaptor protein ClpS